MPHERQAADRPVTGELSLGLVDEAVAAEGDRLLVAEAGAEAVGQIAESGRLGCVAGR